MKIRLIPLLILSLFSCREEEAVWDKLTAAERAALQQRATSKCLADELADINDIISRSTELTEDYRRFKTWEIINTLNDSSLPVNKIHVWKKTATNVYFLYRQSDSSGEFSKFIKVPIAQIEEHFQELRRRKCSASETDSNEFSSATLNSSSMTGSYKYPKTAVDSNFYSILTTTHTYSSDYPSVFGLLVRARVKKFYKKADDVLDKTETYKWTIKGVDDIADDDFSEDPMDSVFINRRYCVATFTPAVVGPPAVPIIYPLPTLDTALNCVDSTTAAAPDADGDGVSDFDSSELDL